jgi:hypothetical protein
LAESALDIFYRSELAATEACGEGSTSDTALILIGRAHEGQSQ